MPSPSDQLRELAANHRWTWSAPVRGLLSDLPGAAPGVHPVATILAAGTDTIAAWAQARTSLIDALHADLAQVIELVPAPVIAYYSPEFGVAAEVGQYSGGLGILAGDHLKAASDVSLPLVGVGLYYRDGFFRQAIVKGVQVERTVTTDAPDVGAVDSGIVVEVPIGGVEVSARVWTQMVGATRLVLLDTNVEANNAAHRSITDRLYSGDRRHRMHQELVLGVGGVRALRALGIAPEVHHLNEGHACFLLLELLGELVDGGSTLDDAVEEVRSTTLFTTHTPVPAGIDRFERAMARPELAGWAARLGVRVDTLLDWARWPSDGPAKPFNTAALAFHLCGRANGVSQLHAGVSRSLFSDIPRAARVEGITNGVHARTWVQPELQDLYDDTLGQGWENGDETAWARVSGLDDSRFTAARRLGRSALDDLMQARTGAMLEPGGCVIGFARRFATYKRASLLLRDPDALVELLDGGARFVFAGKAHPADGDGKAVLAEIVAFSATPEAKGRFVLVPDYDITVAQAMYAGCDVWLNTPVRPHEACGTSGEKAALNGVLNCSILDGWWADWYTDGIGWAIPTAEPVDESGAPGESEEVAAPEEIDDEERNAAEAASLVTLLGEEVLATHRDPEAWWAMTTAMLSHLGPLVTAGRMVREYDRRFYTPIRSSRRSSS